MKSHLFTITGCLVILYHISIASTTYRIGVGIADCTGPAAEIVFMGYARTSQKGCGIHLRQFARAFIFDDGQRRTAFVSVDSGMIGHGIRKTVLERLHGLFNNTYSENNLILSGTHTHGAPGGFLKDLLYDISILGFVKDTFDALVDGIVKSIVKAHKNVVEGRIYINSGELLDANINRSPTAYLLNPKKERDKYEHNVDKEMVQLRLVRSSDNKIIGVINWFAVHPTSMNLTNCLISSDNVGYASLLLERLINDNALPGKGSFVGAFASTNLGDVSPNIKGPRCIDTGELCDLESSTCNGNAQLCIASGPGDDMFDSTRIIAERMFRKAEALLKGGTEVQGPIKSIHQFVDMTKQTTTIKLANGTIQKVKGCLPAMGYSFAAGTTDGPGLFDFSQATIATNPFWNTVRDFIFPPTQEDIDCHHPKPILLNTGRITKPYEWQPRIVSIQLFQIGEVLLIAVPGEFTTMAGRRLRDRVREIAIKNGNFNNPRPIITGLSNIYTSYITTPEEYNKQRYEGASTIYGPHTLPIYLEVYARLAEALFKGEKLDPGPYPPEFPSKLISLVPKVFFDTAGWTHSYGDCVVQPPQYIERGKTVKAVFVSGNPRNNLMHDNSFLAVEYLLDSKNWTVIATDSSWETKFIWKKNTAILGTSEATIEWKIPHNSIPGTYRLRHSGYYKYFFGGKYFYEGISNSFQVI